MSMDRVELKICLMEGASDFYVDHTTYHNDDASLDIFCLKDQIITGHAMGVPIHFGIKCEMVLLKETNYHDSLSGRSWGQMFSKSLSYMLVPRSNISDSPLRMSNSIGIIDSEYRGEIIAKVDNISAVDYVIHKGVRLFQLVHPSLESFGINVDPTDGLSDKSRGEGRFGSTKTNCTNIDPFQL